MAAFIFSCWKYLSRIRFAHSLTRERYFQHSKLKVVSPRGHVTSSIFSSRPTGVWSSRKTLTPRFTDCFTDFEKKTDCFAVYSRAW